MSRLLKDIDLADQKDTLSKDLSGGQKRKLCVGMALIGDPKVQSFQGKNAAIKPALRPLCINKLEQS